MKSTLAVSLIAALGCSACVVSSSLSYDSNVSSGSFALNETVAADGELRNYHLHSDRDGSTTMNRAVKRTYEVAVMGVHTRSIDRGLANGLGVEPWTGVFIEKVIEGSAAADAGLKAGDVLSRVGEQDIANDDQFSDYIREELAAHQEVSVTMSRVSEGGAREKLTLPLTLGAREVSDTETETIQLPSSVGIEARSGMQLATVSGDLSREIWADASPRTYVTGVIVGSPAYLSGIRTGDRLLSFDGDDVESAAGVLEAVAGKSRDFDFEVYGDLGRYESVMTTVDNLDDRSSFHIPIIVGHWSRPHRTETSVLEFIFQFGYNYESTYSETPDREPLRETKLSILPLGMFEFERTPTRSKNTIFWLISWSTRH